MGHKRAKLKLDPEYFGAFGVMCDPSRRPRSDEHHPRLAVLPHEDHVPVALGGAGKRIVAQGSTMHNRFHVGQVRPSFPTGYARTLGPHILNIRSHFDLRTRENASGRSATRVSFGTRLSKPQRLPLTCACQNIRTMAMKPNDKLFAPVLGLRYSRPQCSHLPRRR